MLISGILNFPNLYTGLKNQKLPIKTAYKFHKLAAAITKELDYYYSELQKIIKQYAVVDEETGQPVQTEDGLGIRIQPDKNDECVARLQELQELDVTLPDITFTLEELEPLNLTIDDFDGLSAFITE